MTAEIAVLNRSAVALGADSAITVTKHPNDYRKEEKKVFKGANKIFSASRVAPVGIMIFGNANFMGIPWETIIKEFRRCLGSTTFVSLEEYALNFLGYLENNHALISKHAQDTYIFREIALYALYMAAEVPSDRGKRAANSYVRRMISEHYQQMQDSPLLGEIDEKEFKSIQAKHCSKIDHIIDDVFGHVTISKPNLVKLKFVLASTFTRQWFQDGPSGIVFAGFGEDEYLPQLKAYRLRGVFEDTCSYVSREECSIDQRTQSEVVPFAMTEMVQTFMYGFDPEMDQIMTRLMHTAFSRFIQEVESNVGAKIASNIRKSATEIERTFRAEFAKWVHANHYAPILEIVDALPKDELAELVETLLTMESLKKRVTAPVESVGGPVDVAIISKGDGLVWIRRKHYFEPDRNYEYFQRLRRSLDQVTNRIGE